MLTALREWSLKRRLRAMLNDPRSKRGFRSMAIRFSLALPPGSSHPHPRGWRRRLTPALAAPKLPAPTVQEKLISQTVGGSQARFIRMKSRSKNRTPTIVNLTVKRRYLTEREVERLMPH